MIVKADQKDSSVIEIEKSAIIQIPPQKSKKSKDKQLKTEESLSKIKIVQQAILPADNEKDAEIEIAIEG